MTPPNPPPNPMETRLRNAMLRARRVEDEIRVGREAIALQQLDALIGDLERAIEIETGKPVRAPEGIRAALEFALNDTARVLLDAIQELANGGAIGDVFEIDGVHDSRIDLPDPRSTLLDARAVGQRERARDLAIRSAAMFVAFAALRCGERGE